MSEVKMSETSWDGSYTYASCSQSWIKKDLQLQSRAPQVDVSAGEVTRVQSRSAPVIHVSRLLIDNEFHTCACPSDTF